MIKNILFIGIGGFIGSVARFYVSRLNLHIDLYSIPVGTLLANIGGSLLIGLLIGISDRSTLLSPEIRMFLMVGICGGFTTFSTFASENLMLIRNGQFGPAFIYTGLSLLLGFTAVYLGYILSKTL